MMTELASSRNVEASPKDVFRAIAEESARQGSQRGLVQRVEFRARAAHDALLRSLQSSTTSACAPP